MAGSCWSVEGTGGTGRKRFDLGAFIGFSELIGYVSRRKLVCVPENVVQQKI